MSWFGAAKARRVLEALNLHPKSLSSQPTHMRASLRASVSFRPGGSSWPG